MLDRTKHIISLSTWHIEKRGKRYFIVKPQFFREPGNEFGPYGSAISACLCVGRVILLPFDIGFT